MLTATDLRKAYGKKENRFEALKGVSLKIKDGESVAIVGKSGSGKSTLMHLLAGLDTPTSGSIMLGDAAMSGMKEGPLSQLRNRKIGFIFQQFFLQPGLSVLENVALPLKIGGVGRPERLRRATAVLESVGLADKLRNRAVDLSGGQKQRVAIARALVSEPEVIFADEPTGNLDTESGAQVTDLMFKLQKEKGITLVIVTHDSDLAERCDRTIHIKDGLLVSHR